MYIDYEWLSQNNTKYTNRLVKKWSESVGGCEFIVQAENYT